MRPGRRRQAGRGAAAGLTPTDGGATQGFRGGRASSEPDEPPAPWRGRDAARRDAEIFLDFGGAMDSGSLETAPRMGDFRFRVLTSPRSGRVRPESEAAAALLSVSVSSAAEGVFFSAVKDGGAEAFSYSGGVASLDGGLPIPARARLPHVGDRQSRRRKERRLVDGGLCGHRDFARCA